MRVDTLQRRERHTPAPLAGPAPAVSVVVPCYNYARFLPACLESILSQESVRVDVTVVDDASTDDSLAVARGLAARDSRVAVLANRSNQGPVATFNKGLGQAHGEFLVRLDADDLLTPGSLARAAAAARAFPDAGLVYGHPLHFTGSRLPAAREKATAWILWPGGQWLRERCLTGVNVITSPEVLMRRSVVDRLGGQMPLAHAHDMEMWLRLAAFSDVVYIGGADQAWHREHPASLSAREVDKLADLHERLAAFDTLFAGAAAVLPAAGELHRAARLALAAQAVDFAAQDLDGGRDRTELRGQYLAFARTLAGDLEAIPGWTLLDKRMRLGPRRTSRHPQFLLSRVRRRLRAEISQIKWHRSGVY